MTARFWIGLSLGVTVLASSCSTNQTGAPDSEPVATATSTSSSTVDADENPSSSEPPVSGQDQDCEYNVSVVFVEGAPRDRFTISNDSASDAELATVEIDLSDSAGEIIFDTIDGGSGVEVFQDFQVEDGDAVLESDPTADDGDASLALAFDSFAPGQSFTFSIDVDDQLADSDLGQTQVTDAEIAGASITVRTDDAQEVSATFGAEANAVATSGC